MEAVNAGIDDKLFAYIKESIEKSSFYHLLGMELQLVAPGYGEIKAISTMNHTNPIGMIHGGLIMSIADGAMGTAVRSMGIVGVTVDISSSLTAAAGLGDTLVAKGKVLRAGKNLIFTEAMVYAGDSLVGNSKATFYKIADINY